MEKIDEKLIILNKKSKNIKLKMTRKLQSSLI